MRKRLDAELSPLQWRNENRLRVLEKMERGGTHIMKKKCSLALLLALSLMLISAAALAAGSLFSPRYDALKLADAALEQKYGLTAEMMTLFHRTLVENADGSAVVLYEAEDPGVRAGENRLGVYSVFVQAGKAEAGWSLEHVDTAGGLSARAWGAEQLTQYIRDFQGTTQYMKENGLLRDAALPEMTWEEYTRRQQENRMAVEAAAKITLAEAESLARQAIAGEYALDEAQAALLSLEEEDSVYALEYILEAEIPCVRLHFWLKQGEAWQEKDGIYSVLVNMESGVIEEMRYDSALAGNG